MRNKYYYELEDCNRDLFSLKERRNQLIHINEECKDFPQSLRSAIVLEILENGVKSEIYDKEYFITYLKNPLKNWHMNTNKIKGDLYDHTWNSFLHNLQNRKGGILSPRLESKLYKKYLEYFYHQNGNISEFAEFFEVKFWKETVEEIQFLSGKNLKGSFVNSRNIEYLKQQVLIDLLNSNKETFNSDEKVRISADLK